MRPRMNEPRGWRWFGKAVLYGVAGPPLLFLLLSPLLALLGYATGWFAPGRIGDIVGLIALGGAVAVGLLAAVLAVVAAAVTVVGTVAAAAVSTIAHILARFR